MNYKTLLTPHPIFERLQQVISQHQLKAYVVGGFVRDLFLQRPSKDIDIVCVGDGIALAEHFAKSLGEAKVHIFKRFGTAMVRWGDWEVEFVGARKESYQKDSRKPLVTNGTLEDDILRRDFTINTLALSLQPDSFGDLVDMCNGLADLDKGVIRTPLAPQKTFADDPLRMLRAIRFATQLKFSLTTATFEAIQAEKDRLGILSKERITSELNKILLADEPDHGLLLLDKAGLLINILPELEELKGQEVIGRHTHKENFLHTLQVVRNVADQGGGLWLRWAALLHDIAKPATKRFDPKMGFTFHGHEYLGSKMVLPIFRRLRLPLKQEMRYVQKLVRLHLRHMPLIEDEVTDSAIRRFIYDAGEELEDLLCLCKADITSGNSRKVALYRANFDRLAKEIMRVEEQDRVRTLEPVIDGHMIMTTFDVRPCRAIGQIKSFLKALVLEGEVPNTVEALYPHMMTKAKELGLVLVKKKDALL